MKRNRGSPTLALWSGYVSADICKDAIIRWARELEFGAITEIEGIADGRLDVLLFPLGMKCRMWQDMGQVYHNHWTERCGVAGVEVKVENSDFRKGLSEQFARYGKSLSGLYVAGPAHIVNASEVPAEFGVLQVKSGKAMRAPPVAICRRHPQWRKSALTAGQVWTILWKAYGKMQEQVIESRREKDAFVRKFRERAGAVLADAVAKSLTLES